MIRRLLVLMEFLALCLSFKYTENENGLRVIMIDIPIFLIFTMIVIANYRRKFKETGNEMPVSHQLVTPLNFLFVLLMSICAFILIYAIVAIAFSSDTSGLGGLAFGLIYLSPLYLIVFILGILIAIKNRDTKHTYEYKVFRWISLYFLLLFPLLFVVAFIKGIKTILFLILLLEELQL